MEDLRHEVSKLLVEQPSVACGTALLDAVFECPADWLWTQQLLARWDAHTAAAKLVEGWGRQMAADRGQQGPGQPPEADINDLLDTADARLWSLQFAINTTLRDNGQAAEPAGPQPEAVEQEQPAAAPVPLPACRLQQARRSSAAAAAAAAALARHNKFETGGDGAAGGAAAAAAAAGTAAVAAAASAAPVPAAAATPAAQPAEAEVIDLVDSEEEAPAGRPAQQAQRSAQRQAQHPSATRHPMRGTRHLPRVAGDNKPSAAAAPAAAGGAAAAAAAGGSGGRGEAGRGQRPRLPWRRHIASVTVTKVPTAREIELWEMYKPKPAQPQQQQQQQQAEVARSRRKRAGASQPRRRAAQKRQRDPQPKQRPDESSEEEEVVEDSEEEQQAERLPSTRRPQQVEEGSDDERTPSL